VSERPRESLPELTEDWPDDANDELARLGQDLFAAAPPLPQIALDRIQVRMRQEMDRASRTRRLRTFAACAVAAVAVGLGVYGWVRTGGPRDAQPAKVAAPAEAPAAVRDRYDVTLPPTAPAAPDRPLIDLRRYDELFTKEPKR
jgi:hypothetical protein